MISLLVPFHNLDNENARAANWQWLRSYWSTQLPGSEIIIGEDPYSTVLPFSKAVAINTAAAKATGDIFVIVDADGYIPASSVLLCAARIRAARERKQKLWFVPYRSFYRLNKEATELILKSSPDKPYQFTNPPPPSCIIDTSGSQHGHWFGAGIQIMPREAFEEIGGWDPRFRGWGGEDHSAMRAMDTLYWPHKTLPGQFIHMWHPMFSPEGSSPWVNWKYRMWANQVEAGANDVLSIRYYGAQGHVERMRKLVNEGREFKESLP